MTPKPPEDGATVLTRALALGPGASRKEHSAFMNALRDWVMTISGPAVDDPAGLPALAGMAYVLFTLWSEVGSSGLEFWIGESWEARHIDLVEAGCDRIGATETLELLGQVRDLFPDGIPTDEDEMGAALEAFENRHENPLTELTREMRPVLEAEIPSGLHEYFSMNRDDAIAEE